MVLTGSAGIGKTRLAEEVSRTLVTRSWYVVSRHATTQTRELPLALFVDLLQDPPARPSAGEAIADAYRLLAARLGSGASLVVVDDADLLDDASAMLVQRLVENAVAPVILTVRAGRRLPEGIDVLARAGRMERVSLDALAESDARHLARIAARGRLSDEQLDDVSRTAGGSPLFVLALVAHRDGDGRDDLPVSSLGELVARTLGRPEPGDLDALELIALGEPLELRILDKLCDAASLERLEAAGLVDVVGDRRRQSVRIAHPIYAEAVLAMLRPLHRRTQLRRLADELEALGRARRDDDLRLVLWRQAAGDPVSERLVLQAAHQAVARGGLAVAERLVRDHLDPTRSVDAAHLLASIVLEQGRPAEAAAICAAAPATGDPATLTRLAITWCIIAFAYLGDIAAARAVVERYRDVVPLPWRHELDVFEITLSFYSGDNTDAMARVDQLLATDDVPERTRVWFLLPGVLALATGGRVTDARAQADRVLAGAPALAGDIVGIEGHAGCVYAYASTLHGDLRGVAEIVEARRLGAQRDGDTGVEALLSIVGGFVALFEGQLALAAERLDVSGNVGGGWELAARAWRVHALALAGRVEEARTLLASTGTIPQFAFHHALNLYAIGEVAAASGQLTRAAVEFEEAAAHATEHGAHAYAVLSLFRAFGVQPTSARAERVLAAAPSLDGPLGSVIGAVAAGWSARDVRALQRSVTELEELGSRVLACHVRDVVAALVVLQSPGTAAASAAATAAAVGWAEVRAAARRRSVRVDTAGLTKREREVVMRAAEGMADNTIALDLGISPRTVHAHLRSAYRKLGVSGRHDL